MTVTNQAKYEVLNKLLEQEYLLIHVNPLADGVEVPAYLKKEKTLTLKLSRLFRGTMSIEEEQELVTADLLFGGKYYTCRVPFHSLWGVTDVKGESLIWPDSIPPQMTMHLAVHNPVPKVSEEATQEKKETSSSKPALRRVK